MDNVKMPPDDGGTFGCYLLFFLFSHCWFAMPQLVLQADWQVLLHSPQAVIFLSAGRAIVLILFMPMISFSRFFSIII